MTPSRSFCFRVSAFLLSLAFVWHGAFAQNPWETDAGLQSDVPMPLSVGNHGQGATTKDPIFLLKGSVTEAETDLSFPTPLLHSWQHRRTYDSAMTSGVVGQDLLGSHGHSWLGGNQAEVLTQSGGETQRANSINSAGTLRSASNSRGQTGGCPVHGDPAYWNEPGYWEQLGFPPDFTVMLTQSASNRRTFTANDNTLNPPPDFRTTLLRRAAMMDVSAPVNARAQANTRGQVNTRETTHASDQDEYVLTMLETGEVSIYYGFSSAIPPNRRGKLKERTNVQYAAQGLPGELYHYDGRGFVTSITTAYPQQYCIQYTHDVTGNTADRLTKIEVYTGLPDEPGTVKFAQAEYLYWESLDDTHDDVGSFGDLVQVKVSTLASDGISWQTRITQYRYHRDGAVSSDGSKDGRNHQLKAVFEPDAIERLLTANNNVTTSEDILLKSDAESLVSGHSVFSYASRAFTYYMANLTTTGSTSTVWGTEDLSAKYGGLEQDELKPLVDGSGNPVHGYFIPRVRTEVVNAGCFSCSGGSTGGVKKSYYYMQLHPAPEGYADSDPNAVTYLVVEDTVDSSNTPILRTIYGLDHRGKELRRVDIENPVDVTLNTVAKSSLFDTNGKLIEQRPGDTHVALDTNTKISQFLNPYDPGTSSWTNDTATLQTSKGVIAVYEYDANGNRTGTKRKVGSGGTAYYVSAADYNANDQITAKYIYPTQTTSRAAADRVATNYSYTYWDQEQKVIKTKQTTEQAIPVPQNGSGVAAVSDEYYDESGRLRWTRDALGVVAYYGYHPWNGMLTLVVRDVDTASLPAVVTTGSDEVAAWNAVAPFSRDGTLPTAFNQTRQYGYDNLGRQNKSVDTTGVASYIAYDVNRTIHFSAWDDTIQRPVLPISVTETNAARKPVAVYELPPTAVVVANGKPSGISTGTAKVSWTRFTYDASGSLQHVDRYHTIPASGIGTLGTNFYRTVAIHDPQGRHIATAQYVTDNKWQVETRRLNWRGWVAEGLTGVSTTQPTVYTDLVGATYLTTIFQRTYAGEVLARMVQFSDSTQSNGVGVNYHYDSMYRLRGASSFSMSGSTETPFGPYPVSDYDWRGRVVAQATFDNEPTWSNVINNTSYAAGTTDSRTGLQKGYYDDANRIYRRETYKIATAGSADSCIRDDCYYDSNGRIVATQRAGGTAEEIVYDAIGRPYQQRTLKSLSSTKYSSGQFQYRSPQPALSLSGMSGGGEGVSAIVHVDYDANGRVVAQHTLDLAAIQNAGLSLASNNYVRQTVYHWYDNANRLLTRADYGSGSLVWTFAAIPSRPGTAPTESTDHLLVSQTAYNPATGRLDTTINPKGITTKVAFDALGRSVTSTINTMPSGAENDQNLETLFAYDGLNNVVTQTVVNPTTGDQVTKYIYEDPARATLVTSAIYPDSTDTTSAGNDQIKKTYHVDGRLNTVTDQNGTVRMMLYDLQRRLTGDQVMTLGSGVDGTVRKMTRTYNVSGLLESAASLDSGNAVLNEVRFEYDDDKRLVRKYDAFTGAVQVMSSPYLQYGYDDTAVGSVLTRAGRLAGVTYPGGKQVDYAYGAADSFDDLQNRPQAIWLNGSTVAQYDYSGLGVPMQTSLPEPDLTLTLQDGGLDRLGRVANHAWMKGNDPLVHIIHDYDYASNRTSRYDAVHADISELYEYDQVDQVKSLNRGVLNLDRTAVTASNFTESWDFDKTGNWLTYNRNGTIENRTHNKANELQTIATHDGNGNMTVMSGQKAKYDAWNRLVELRDASDSVISRYEYNGLNHRIAKKTYFGGTLAETRHYFCNDRWQCLEEWVNGQVDRTYVWGLRGIDDMVCRERNDERIYPLTDPNGNVVAIVDVTGNVKERYRYDAFGNVAYLNPDFTEKAASEFDWDYLYTSRQLDQESGLMYSRYRYYRPDFGRFVNRDPIEYEAGDVNLYRYVANQAISAGDPWGLFQIGDGTPPGVPSVSPLGGGGTPPGVPNVSPLGGGGTSPGVPNVSPVGAGGTPPSVPNVGSGSTDSDASCPRPPYEQIDLSPYVWDIPNNNNNSTGYPIADWLIQQGLRRGRSMLQGLDPTHGYQGRTRGPTGLDWVPAPMPTGRPTRSGPLGDTYIQPGRIIFVPAPGRPWPPRPPLRPQLPRRQQQLYSIPP